MSDYFWWKAPVNILVRFSSSGDSIRESSSHERVIAVWSGYYSRSTWSTRLAFWILSAVSSSVKVKGSRETRLGVSRRESNAKAETTRLELNSKLPRNNPPSFLSFSKLPLPSLRLVFFFLVFSLFSFSFLSWPFVKRFTSFSNSVGQLRVEWWKIPLLLRKSRLIARVSWDKTFSEI